jgi:hypothetical protein
MFTGHLQYPLMSDFNKILIFSTDFRNILEHEISQNTRPVVAQLLHADGRTDRHERNQ